MPRFSHALICALVPILLSSCAISRGRRVREPVQSLSPTASAEFRQAAGSLLGNGFVPGNAIETLVNGDQIFSAMLQAIRTAKRSINFETYVFWDGDVGQQFTTALAERAAAGVKVHLILDAQGTQKMGRDNLARLKRAGAEVVKYHPLLWWDPRRYNNRTHRKLLIVDGKVGFIGGVGIADEWKGNAQSPEHWRDNHYRITGPVVAQLQGVFMDNWLKTRGTVLNGSGYFPSLAPSGPYLAQAFKSSPRYGENNVLLMYLLTIASAQKTVRIENSYFVPDDDLREALIAAAQRGVKVEILVPGKHIDQKSVRRASKRHWKQLLKAGVQIHEFEPTMLHVKLMIVDDLFVSIGSANFDNRSLRLNAEANLNVLSSSFAKEQIRLFEKDKARSQAYFLNEREELTLADAPLNHAVGVTAPQL